MGSGGYVRVVNYRMDMQPDGQPEDDETIVVVDRRNPVLGNRHILFKKTDLRERERVIRAFARDLDGDIERKGDMFMAILDLAKRVHGGEKIALQCACKPSPCHGDVIAKKIDEFVKLLIEGVDLMEPV
jgi:Domain of unknown function (DUF4326)